MITSIKITSFILQSLIIINYDNAGPNDVMGGGEMNEQIITMVLPLTQGVTSPININEQHRETNDAKSILRVKKRLQREEKCTCWKTRKNGAITKRHLTTSCANNWKMQKGEKSADSKDNHLNINDELLNQEGTLVVLVNN